MRNLSEASGTMLASIHLAILQRDEGVGIEHPWFPEHNP